MLVRNKAEHKICPERMLLPERISPIAMRAVDQDMAFASLYALVRIETTSTTTLGRLDRLTTIVVCFSRYIESERH